MAYLSCACAPYGILIIRSCPCVPQSHRPPPHAPYPMPLPQAANIPPTDGTTPVQDNNNHNNNNPDGAIHARGSLRRAAIATGPTSPLDPFALSFGGFRRLMLPRGAEACSKGHSLFYGQGLGPPPRALRKVHTYHT